MKLELKPHGTGCHICSHWTALYGCNHYGPQDYDANKEFIDTIVAAVHGGDKRVVETRDFTVGITATLIFLRQNGLLHTTS